MTFFLTINGKPAPNMLTKQQFEEYKSVCELAFGAIPYDISWALENPIYKQIKEKYDRNKNVYINGR